MNLQVGVKILLQNSEGKYLLVHRSIEKYPDVEDKWDIVGGRINAGSTLLENLKREIKEETGLDLVNEPTLIAAQDIIKNPDFHVVRLTYIGRADGQVTLDTNENDEYRWCSREELEKLDGLDIYFKDLLNGESLWKQKM